MESQASPPGWTLRLRQGQAREAAAPSTSITAIARGIRLIYIEQDARAQANDSSERFRSWHGCGLRMDARAIAWKWADFAVVPRRMRRRVRTRGYYAPGPRVDVPGRPR